MYLALYPEVPSNTLLLDSYKYVSLCISDSFASNTQEHLFLLLSFLLAEVYQAKIFMHNINSVI